jgi:enoyl-CoA hydratase
MACEHLIVETRGSAPLKTGWITLNRPKALNALNEALMDELAGELRAFDADDAISCIVLTGSDKAFAAGADVGAMAGMGFVDAYRGDFITRNWEAVRSVRKPVIAAVAGYALGGGCELVMMCDLVIAADSAKFGQPEIKLGIIPGAGGTQRLPRAIGKAKAMDLVLTARTIGADEAERCGLVSRVVPAAQLHAEVQAVADAIGQQSLPSLMAAKECVNRAFESGLADGVMFERRMFHAMFATDDQKEGMAAFLAKRAAQFTHR